MNFKRLLLLMAVLCSAAVFVSAQSEGPSSSEECSGDVAIDIGASAEEAIEEEIVEEVLVEDLEEPFNLLAFGGEWSQEDENGVSISKEIFPNDGGVCPNFELTVQMPHYQSYMSVVVAIDSSGSMRQTIDASDADWIADSVDALLGQELFRDGGSNVSIVSWDSEVDFSTEMFSLSENQSKAIDSLNNQKYLETETTVYDIGLREAVHVLKKNPPKDPANTKEIIIFVTGWSEFAPGARLEDTITEAANSGYEVYTIGLGISETNGPMQYQALKNMAEVTGGAFYPSEDNLDSLAELVTEIYESIESRPVATNLLLTYTLFPYLDVVGTSFEVDLVENADGTNTLNWDIGEMKKDQVETLEVQTALQMTIPADVTSSVREMVYKADGTTPSSGIAYTWLTGEAGNIEMSAGEIEIGCGSSE